MRKLLKRFAAAASAVVIGGVTCVTTWFSVPVSAAAGVGWLEWLEFQSLLQGIGIGGSNDDFVKSVDNWTKSIGGPEMPREDYDGEWMTNYEYYNRLGWDSIIGFFDNLADSWTEDYTSIPDVGTDVSGGSSDSQYFKLLSSGVQRFLFHDSTVKFSLDGSVENFGTSGYGYGYDDFLFTSNLSDIPVYLYYCTSDSLLYCIAEVPSFVTISSAVICNKQGLTLNWRSLSQFSIGDIKYIYSQFNSKSSQKALDIFSVHGINVVKSDMKVSDFVKSNVYDATIVDSENFVGPVYTYPAAQELYKSTGTAAGIRLDVQTEDGVPDIQAALDGAGVKTVDDLVAGVAAGTVPMSKVFSDAKVTPYVVADTATGAVVTDLGVSATAAGVKAVGLTQELAVPKDLTNAVAYPIKGKTWDPEMSKYKLPLFEYFPFCLPWDIYQVLAAFSADPVAPVFDVPVGKILSGVRSADVSKAASVSAKIDFGDDNWSKVFEIIRILECAGIIVGLCLVAVYLIHGGR